MPPNGHHESCSNNCFAGCRDPEVQKVMRYLRDIGCHSRHLNAMVCYAIAQGRDADTIIDMFSTHVNGHGTRLEAARLLQQFTK